MVLVVFTVVYVPNLNDFCALLIKMLALSRPTPPNNLQYDPLRCL